MKRYLLTYLSIMSVLMVGCEMGDNVTAVTLTSISQKTFDYRGGLASAVVDAGNAGIEAESDADWCKVAVFGTSVNFNVFSFTGDRDRTAAITISANGLKPLTINITQTRFAGLIVTPTSITFSTTVRSFPVEVTASAEYTVTFSENPGNAFSYEKTDTGVTFTSNNEAGRDDIMGRAVLTPTEGEEVVVSLLQPRKSVYNNLIGTWSIINNEPEYGTNLQSPATFTFTMKEEEYSYYVHVDTDKFGPDNVFTAEFKNGSVVIQSGQQMGTIDVDGTKMYVNLHFNGTVNGSGNSIFTAPGSVAWAATPVFNESFVTLEFADNGQGKSNAAVTMCLFRGPEKHFTFTENIGNCRNLVLRKMITE